MVTVAERLGIVETKVVNLDEKLDDIKNNVKEMHDCLDKNRDRFVFMVAGAIAALGLLSGHASEILKFFG